jgi:hypothetical protein
VALNRTIIPSAAEGSAFDVCTHCPVHPFHPRPDLDIFSHYGSGLKDDSKRFNVDSQDLRWRPPGIEIEIPTEPRLIQQWMS